MKQKKKLYIYIIHACNIIIFILYSLPYFICIIAVILNTLYACYCFMSSRCFILILSENSSDELMLPNYHVTDVK